MDTNIQKVLRKIMGKDVQVERDKEWEEEILKRQGQFRDKDGEIKSLPIENEEGIKVY